jgi:sugar lactone lactonase YvrE
MGRRPYQRDAAVRRAQVVAHAPRAEPPVAMDGQLFLELTSASTSVARCRLVGARLPAGIGRGLAGVSLGAVQPECVDIKEGRMRELEAELLFDAKGLLSESPHWSGAEQALYWVDIENGLLHRLDWRRRNHECVSLPAPVTMVIPGPRLLVTSGNRLLRFEWTTRQSELVAALALDPTCVRFNDGQLDPQGRLWLGTMAIDEQSPIAGLYRLDGQTLEQVLADVTVSNGLVWSGDTVYYADSGTFRVDAFDYDVASGTLAADSRRTILEFGKDDGPPDGMALDSDGNLWVALVKGRRVSCFSPHTGDELARIHVDAAKVCACCFGGPEMQDLIISTGRDGEGGPAASGALFVAQPGVRGVLAPSSPGIA